MPTCARKAFIASGANYPDALTGGKKLSDTQKAYIKSFAPALVTAFGGVNAVSDEMLTLVIKAVR